MSNYRPSFALLSDPEGRLAPAVPAVAGIYAPGAPLQRFADDDGRHAVLFPAKREWIQPPNGIVRDFPWPGWKSVEFDASTALSEFVRIDTEDRAIQFAQRYGPLWACPKHPFPCLWRAYNGPDEYGIRHDWIAMEPVDWWLGAAGRVRAALVAAEFIQRGEHVPAEQWKALGWGDMNDSLDSWTESFFLSSSVSGELQRYLVGLHLSDDLHLELNSGLGFLPALWQQAAATIAGGRSLAVCTNCAKPYVRVGRAPKKGQRNYCPACGYARRRFSYRELHGKQSTKD